MDFSIKTIDARTGVAGIKTDCIVVGVFENKKLSQAARSIDRKGDITAALKSGDISGKPGSTLLMRNVDGVAAERILLIGLGNEDSVTEKNFLSSAQAMARVFASLGARDAIIALPL